MGGKYALVFGNSQYVDPGLSALITPGKDAADFARVLQDPDLCGFDQVKVVIDEISSSAIEAIDEFFDGRKPDDLLILYFSGHGVRDELGSLYLACKNTLRTRLRSSAIRSEYIREAMDQSRAKRQVLILDCCNSGAFKQGSKAAIGGPMGMTTAFQGYGRYVLTASDATQYAWEGDQAIGDTENSLFTHFLIRGLEGEADRDGDGRITVDDLYDYTFDQVARSNINQTPTKSASRQEGDIILRQITRLQDIRPIALPDDLLEAADDTRPFVREAAVQQLIRLLQGRNLGLARSARAALERIASNDDSLRVRQTAQQALESAPDVLAPEAPAAAEPPPQQAPRKLVDEAAPARIPAITERPSQKVPLEPVEPPPLQAVKEVTADALVSSAQPPLESLMAYRVVEQRRAPLTPEPSPRAAVPAAPPPGASDSRMKLFAGLGIGIVVIAIIFAIALASSPRLSATPTEPPALQPTDAPATEAPTEIVPTAAPAPAPTEAPAAAPTESAPAQPASYPVISAENAGQLTAILHWQLGEGGTLHHFAASPDLSKVATIADDRQVRLWDLSGDGSQIWKSPDSGLSARAVRFSPDGGKLAFTAYPGDSLQIVNVDDRSTLTTNGTPYLVRLAFSPDGKLIVAAGYTAIYVATSDASQFSVWVRDTGTAVMDIAYDPKTDGFATALFDRVGLWKVQYGEGVLMHNLYSDLGYTLSMAYSPDGSLLAVAYDTNPVVIWRMEDRSIAQTLRGHTGGVNAIAFSPDGQLLATGSEDRTVRLWRVSDGQLLRTSSGGIAGVLEVAFSKDGTRVLSAAKDGTVRMWAVVQ